MANPRPSFQVKALTIVCSDGERSDRFYRTVLGAIALSGDLTCRWYRLGTFSFTLVPNGEGHSPARFGKHPLNMLYLEVDDLALAVEHFARHHVEVVQSSDGQMVIIADPDGLPIEVWQREDDEDPA